MNIERELESRARWLEKLAISKLEHANSGLGIMATAKYDYSIVGDSRHVDFHRLIINLSTPMFCLDIVEDSRLLAVDRLMHDRVGGRSANDLANQFAVIDSTVRQFFREQAWVTLNNYLVLNSNVSHHTMPNDNPIRVWMQHYTSPSRQFSEGTILVPFGDTLFGPDWLNLPNSYLCHIKGLDLSQQQLASDWPRIRAVVSQKLRQTPIHNFMRGAMNAVWANNPKKL